MRKAAAAALLFGLWLENGTACYAWAMPPKDCVDVTVLASTHVRHKLGTEHVAALLRTFAAQAEPGRCQLPAIVVLQVGAEEAIAEDIPPGGLLVVERTPGRDQPLYHIWLRERSDDAALGALLLGALNHSGQNAMPDAEQQKLLQSVLKHTTATVDVSELRSSYRKGHRR
jgi:hypothetical protein